MSAELIARLLAQRERWVDLEPGKRVRIRRPAESDIGRFARGVSVDQIAATVVGWEGFTEVDVLGASQGSSSAVEFDSGLWAELMRDRMDWFDTAASAVMEAIREHMASREAARKN